MSSDQVVMIFVRFPEPGAVKTRLAATIGDDHAAALYQLMTEDQVYRLRRASLEENFKLALYSTPVDRLAQVAMWLNDGKAPIVDAIPQPERDLAGKLDDAARQAFTALKAQRVCIIGSDCPDIAGDHIARAFALLGENDAVLGPAADGGFYVLGLRRYEPGLFDGVEYSQADTASQLAAALAEKGYTVDSKSLPVLQDIDEREDFAGMTPQTRERLTILGRAANVELPE